VKGHEVVVDASFGHSRPPVRRDKYRHGAQGQLDLAVTPQDGAGANGTTLARRPDGER
jgi:hypothetical protein